MRGAALVLGVLAAVGMVAAVPCGTWTMGCRTYNNMVINGEIVFNGLNAGDYTWSRSIVNTSSGMRLLFASARSF
jgi:hypothetical protein